MGNWQAGDMVWCVPTRIDRDGGATVRISKTGEEAYIAKPHLVPEGTGHNYDVYSGSLLCHEPYDSVRPDRPFIAKVLGSDPLTLSRGARIGDLWKDLIQKAHDGGVILATITGQNKWNYALSLEGNIFLHCNKEPLVDHLQPLLPTDALWHKDAPMKGDTIVAKVLVASDTTGNVTLDLLLRLRRLEVGKLDEDLLRRFGTCSSGMPVQRAGTINKPSPLQHRSIDLLVARSPELDAARASKRTIIVESDARFGNALAWMLCEMGYAAEYVPSVEKARAIGAVADDNTVFVVDVRLDPDDGISLVRQLTAAADGHKPCRCILMSASGLDDPLETAGRRPLREVLAEFVGRCPFWSKAESNLEESLRELDDLLLN